MKKRILAVVLVCALLLSFLPPSAALAAVDYSYIRVGLTSMGSPTSVTFKVAGAYRIAESSSTDLFPGITYTLKADVTTDNKPCQKLSYNNGVGTVTVTLPATITFMQYSNGSTSNFLYINNPGSGYGWRYYSGNMTVTHPSGTTYLQFVNTVFLETYLYGVVAYEMGDTWPVEALKSQAICARTYAIRFIKSNPSATYHIGDTSLNQVYRGYPVNSNGTFQQNVINAVDATRGKVLFLGNPTQQNLADGVFSASNGGQVRTASMRWGGANTYHVFKDDPYDLRNTSSPAFTYILPKTNNAATLNLLSTDDDKNKANTMLTLLGEKLPAAVLAQKGINCTAANITINGIKSATPVSLREGMPLGSKEFTQVSVTVNVTINNVTLPAPAVVVKGNGATIASGDTTPSAADATDFGSVPVAGSTATKTYTIYNTGNAALNISAITLTGANAADFALTSAVPASIASGGSAAFTVAFDPSVAGSRGATVNIASNAAGSPYTFAIGGMGALDSTKDITSFGFAAPAVTGTITGTNIAVTVPAGTDVTKLIATFTTTGKVVKVNGVNGETQASGVTPNDFTSPVVYTVIAEDNSSKDYTVTVTAAAGLASGGGGMPASTTCDITVTLNYISKASNGQWNVLGEMRTRFQSFYSLLGTTNLWLLYTGQSADGKFLYVTARGYGHGVGLSQRGAQQMAKEQKTYLNIIDFYFNTSAGLTSISGVPLTQKALAKIPGNSAATAQFGKVTASTLNVRAAANSTGTVVASLTKDTVVEILSTSGTWYRILYAAKGLVGYVSKDYITRTTAPTATPSPTPTRTASPTPSASSGPTAKPPLALGRVIATSLYMRSQPNATASTVYTLKKNDTVTILDSHAATNWYKVKYAGYTGYCMYQSGTTVYIQPVGATGATPTPTAGTVLTVKAVTAKPNVTDYLTLRGSASTSGTKVAQIPKGATFTVTEVATTASWLKVSYSGKSGYVLAQYAIVGGNSAYRTCTVTTSQLNVRSGAGSNYGVIGILKAGNTVTVMSKSTVSSITWYKITTGSVTGYIDSRYARISTP